MRYGAVEKAKIVRQTNQRTSEAISPTVNRFQIVNIKYFNSPHISDFAGSTAWQFKAVSLGGLHGC
jgi:hypothetical protein